MREIKFRGKHLENSEWVIGWLTKHIDGGEDSWVIVRERTMVWHYADPSTVGQFTGLKDVNEEEIYEGDILKNHGHPYEDITVGFHDGMFVDIATNLPIGLDNEGMPIASDVYEVIGNIHD